MLLSTDEVIEVLKQTEKIATIVEIPEVLEPHRNNWVGHGMFFDSCSKKFCFNIWIENYGYPNVTEEVLKKSTIHKDLKWVIDDSVQKALPPKK